MNIAKLNWLGEKSYDALGSCVAGAIVEQESEHAIICGVALVRLAKAEGANYFGTKGPFNYNTAFKLGKEAVILAEREGIPAFLEDDKRDLQRMIKEFD